MSAWIPTIIAWVFLLAALLVDLFLALTGRRTISWSIRTAEGKYHWLRALVILGTTLLTTHLAFNWP